MSTRHYTHLPPIADNTYLAGVCEFIWTRARAMQALLRLLHMREFSAR